MTGRDRGLAFSLYPSPSRQKEMLAGRGEASQHRRQETIELQSQLGYIGFFFFFCFVSLRIYLFI